MNNKYYTTLLTAVSLIFFAACMQNGDIKHGCTDTDEATDLQKYAAQGDTKAIIELFKNHNKKKGFFSKKSKLDVNERCSKHNPALIYAIKNGHLEVVKILLENGANLNIRLNEGYRPLIIAAEYLRNDMVALLLENKAEPNHKNSYGKTALMRLLDIREATNELEKEIYKSAIKKECGKEISDEDLEERLKEDDAKRTKIAALLIEKLNLENVEEHSNYVKQKKEALKEDCSVRDREFLKRCYSYITKKQKDLPMEELL